MKRIATIINEKNQVTGIIHGPDAVNQSITVNGRKWYFDFDKWCGPLWLKADMDTPRKCQFPTNKAVWDEFDKWLKKYLRAEKKFKRLKKKL